MENEQRRSPRIMFSIPVTVRGQDEKGKPFETTGRTVTLNRQGARIQVARPLKVGQTVHIINQANNAETEFRVVGPITPPLDQVGEWGIECLRLDLNIWDIYFPSSSQHADSDASLLLSCRHCHAMSLQSLSLVEVEVLDTAGLLTKPCVHCGEPTAWGYANRTFAEENKTYQAVMSDATSGSPTLTAERRKSSRKPAQLPVRVRDYYGEIEITQTENISNDGFCFTSPRKYLVGQGIVVICPFDAANEKPEVRARIVRTELGSSPNQHIYGVHYEQAPH